MFFPSFLLVLQFVFYRLEVGISHILSERSLVPMIDQHHTHALESGIRLFEGFWGVPSYEKA